jgi:NTE family protein
VLHDARGSFAELWRASWLDDLPAERQELLINWGYVITDTGLRKHVRPELPAGSLPYPGRPLVR